MSGYLPPPPQISPLRTSFAFSSDQVQHDPPTSSIETTYSESLSSKPAYSTTTDDKRTAPDPPNTAPPAINHSSNLLFSSSDQQQNSNYNNQDPQQHQTSSSLGISGPVKFWENSTIRDWLESLNCGRYMRLFEEHHITGEILLECNQSALKGMGIRKVGDRIRIDQALKALRAKDINRDDILFNGPYSSTDSTNSNNRFLLKKSLKDLNKDAVSPFMNNHSSGTSPEDSYFSSRHGQSHDNHQRGGTPGASTSNAPPQRPSQPTKSSSVPNSATLSKTRTQTVVTDQNRNANSNVKNILSMDVVKQNTVKFIYGQGQSKTVNIQGCYSAEQIVLRALKKISVNEVSADGWTVHVADNELGTTTRQVSDAELVTICHSADRKERKRLILCVNGTTPSLKQLSKSQQILRDTLSANAGGSNDSSTNESLLNNSAAAIHGNGDDDDDDDDDDDEETQTVFPEMAPSQAKGRLSKLSGQRPPSELISSNLAHFFPEATPKEIEKTVRNSIRFSKRMSHMSRGSRISNRASVASSLAWGIPETEEDEIPPVPPVPDIEDDSGSSIQEEMISSSGLQGSVERPTPVEEDSGTITSSDSKSISSFGSGIKKPSASTLRNSISKRLSQLSGKSSPSLAKDDGISPSQSRGDDGSGANINDEQETKASEQLQEEYEMGGTKGGQPAENQTITTNEENDDGEVTTAEQESEEGIDKEFLEAIEQEESGPTSWIRGRLIGSGSFGTVFLGMNSFTGELMAVKQVELPSDESESAQRKKNMVDALQREMDILRELQHENIVQYLGTNSEGTVLNIFLEYVPGGSVATLLANYGEFNESLIRNFVRQILQGLKYLHDQNIIHRDIKGANVLVDNKGCIKISDFGISKKIEAKLLTSNRASLQGSVFWMAPEVVKQTSYTLKADIWSLGCLIIEMFSGTHPFPEFTQMQAIFRLGNSGAPTIPPNCTDEAKDFLQQTFAVDHTKRPTAEELLRHPFMKRMIV